MRIKYKSVDELLKLRDAGLAVSEILDDICAAAVPGASTADLDRVAANGISRLKVKSAFLGYQGYPAVLCTSVNEVIVHGIPRDDEVLRDGDIVGIDFGSFMHGFCGDSARTIVVGGQTSPERQKLVDTTRESLEKGIEKCYPGNRLGDIGEAVQLWAEAQGYSVVKDFVGHGVGRQMHEDPPVPNYGRSGTGKRIKSGLVIAIEPMVNAGARDVEVLEDEWTAVTQDRSMSAHFEHTIAITDNGPWVLTQAAPSPGSP
ncbi:MAG: type I methionyl aminopeptidase [Myxococcales bacterium]|nr:type I methionyl aminopeptidase [Myxococcales bacterium]